MASEPVERDDVTGVAALSSDATPEADPAVLASQPFGDEPDAGAEPDGGPDHLAAFGDPHAPVAGLGDDDGFSNQGGFDSSLVPDTTAWLDGSDPHVAGLVDPGGSDLLEGPIVDNNLDGIDDRIQQHHGG